ncbi:MAG: hypothetical protein V4677_15855 [Bacteroidota bacterium]
MKQRVLFLAIYIFSNCLIAQNKLTVNGEAITFDCAKVLSVDEMDTLTMPRVKIYHAEINNNCLELGVFAGDCPANLELVTDNRLIETNTLTLNFLLRYDKDAVPCKATLKTKLYFDILPFKNMRTGKSVMISFLGEKFHLVYK